MENLYPWKPRSLVHVVLTVASTLMIQGCLTQSQQSHLTANLPVFQVADLGTLGGGETRCTVAGDGDSALGRSQLANGRWHAFIWRKGRMYDLEIRPEWNSTVVAVNPGGWITGYTGPNLWNTDQTLPEHQAFLKTGNEVRYLPTKQWPESLPIAMNARGDVVGNYAKRIISPDLADFHGFLWSRSGAVDVTPSSLTASANCINDRGLVAGDEGGSRPYLWEYGRMIKIPSNSHVSKVWLDNRGDLLMAQLSYESMPFGQDSERGLLWDGKAETDIGSLGGQSTRPIDMNGTGMIVGASQVGPAVSSEWHGFLWRDGHIQDLGVPVGANTVWAERISDSGVIGGLAHPPNTTFDSGKGMPFTWVNGHFTAYGLASGPAKDWQITSVVAVSPAGKLLANGRYRGIPRACWLTPDNSRQPSC